MSFFIDTNIFIAALFKEETRSKTARKILNLEVEKYTSLLNLMEIRSVLSKKKQISKDEIEMIEKDIVEGIEIIIPDSSSFIQSNELQKENYLYPSDCLILTLSKSYDAKLVTFDSELIHHGATEPEEIIKEID